jgi:hypothetical protein
MTQRFLDSGGEIREVLLTMLRSEEFWSPEAVGAKVKTPLEFTVSLLRATDADLADLPGLEVGTGEELLPMSAGIGAGGVSRGAPGLLLALRDLGQPLYGLQPPKGYDDRAQAWVSTGAMLQRFKIGFAVAVGKLPGVQVKLGSIPRHHSLESYLAELGRSLLGRTPSEETLKVLQAQLELPPVRMEQFGVPARFARSPEARSRLALAWLAASPEFQRK